MTRSTLLFFALAASLLACETSGRIDAGAEPTDTSGPREVDAGAADIDASLAVDAGLIIDAGAADRDAGAADAGEPACANGGAEGSDGRCRCPRGFAGARCTAEIPPAWDFEAAAAYSASRAGVSLLIQRSGETLFERYERGFGPQDDFHLFSATKGFWALAAAAMVQDGLLEGFDEPVARTFPEWAADGRRAVTVRHLMTLSSGLPQDVERLQGEHRDTHAPDKYAHARSLRLRRAPGASFVYGPVDYYVFGALLKEKTGEDPLAYLERRIFSPIGLEYGRWVRDGVGQAHLPNGAYLTARQWAKFGRLVIDRGRWAGQPVVDPALFDDLLEPSPTNPGHGLFLWLNRPGGVGAVGQPSSTRGPGGFILPEAHPGLFAALGAGRNGLYLLPEHDLVVIRQCHPEGAGEGFGCEEDFVDYWQDEGFLRTLLGTSP